MDFKCKGIAWVGNIRQTFETLCSEVDDIMCQETFNYVENQLQTVGTNVKQFCSEFVQDVLPPFSMNSMKGAATDLSLEENKNTDLAVHGSSKLGVDEDPQKGLCNLNSLPHPSLVEPVEGIHIDSSLKQNADIGMYEKSNVGVKGNHVEEKPFSSEIPDVVAPEEQNSSMASSFCGVNQSNHEEEWDGQVNLSTRISVEGCNSSMKAGETGSLVNATADISSALPSANSVTLVQSCECEDLDSGLASPGDALSAASNDTSAAYVTLSVMESLWAGFELCDEFSKSEDFVPLADSESSDDTSAEEARDDHVSEPGMETTQPYDELKLDESCIVVDGNELCSVSLTPAKCQSYKTKIREAFALKKKLAKEQEHEQHATCYEDLDEGPNQQGGESFVPSMLTTRNLESEDHDFCESEWEII